MRWTLWPACAGTAGAASTSARSATLKLFNGILPRPVFSHRPRRLSVVGRRTAIAIGPARLPRQRHRRLDPDLMPRGGTEFKRLQPPAEQIDLVNRLRALITALEHACRENVGSLLLADADVFRPQRDAHLVARTQRLQQRHIASPSIAEIDQAELAASLDQRAREFVGGAGEIGDKRIRRPIIDLVRRAHL